MNERESAFDYLWLPLCRIKFYHETGSSTMNSAGSHRGADLWALAREAGLEVIYRLGNPTTDLWAYPGAFDEPGSHAICAEVIKAGYRAVPYKRLIVDLNLALSGGRALSCIYHHRPRRQPPEFVLRRVTI